MKDRLTTPFQLLLFLLLVFTVLFCLSYLLPAEVQAPLNLKFRVPSSETLISDIHEITTITHTSPETVISEVDFSHYQPLFPDEVNFFLYGHEDTLQIELPEPFIADASELRSSIFEIQYPEVFVKDLHAFFAKLAILRVSGKVVRVLHYGDSQIEGDRVTSELRNLMQSRFGGMGPGLISVIPPTRQHTNFRLSYTGDWNRYSFQSEEPGHTRWGALFSFARFTKPGEMIEIEPEASFTLQPRSAGYRRSGRFRNAKIFFGYHEKPVYLEFNRTGQVIEADIFPSGNEMNVMQYAWKEPVNNLTVKMKGMSSPDVYALALDDLWGVALDNIPLRGSSGLEFTRTDTAFLRKMYSEFNTGMILLQFGVNVVPHIVSDYSYYEYGLFRQLTFLKKLNPGVPIIILGVSDMSMMDGGTYKSYPNIELIRNAQRNAALRAGCGFWDTYEAMGGENSMAAWAFAEPPLAQKDFTHFSYRGSMIIGQMFWNALLHEYEKFEFSKKDD
jgi:hypothetical protein